MRILVLAILLLASGFSWSADKQAKIRALMEAQGYFGMIEEQLAAAREQGREQSSLILDQVLAGKGQTIPPEAQARFRRAADQFVSDLASSVTTQELVDVIAKSFAADFSDDELDQLVAFYTSALGKKDVAASQRAVQALTVFMTERSKPVGERAAKAYVAELQRIIQECCATRRLEIR